MEAKCYKLDNSLAHKIGSYVVAASIEAYAFSWMWHSIVYEHDLVMAAIGTLWIYAGLLAPKGLMSRHLFITNRGISIVMMGSRLNEPSISWIHLSNVRVFSDPTHVSGVKRIVLQGCEKPRGIMAPRSLTTIIISGLHPDIHNIIENICEVAPEKVHYT